jgi:hypothetical protein
LQAAERLSRHQQHDAADDAARAQRRDQAEPSAPANRTGLSTTSAKPSTAAGFIQEDPTDHE